MSWWCGGIFLVLSLLLSLMSAGTRATSSDLQERLRTTTPPAATTTSPLPITPAPNGPPAGAAPAGTEGAAKAPPNPATPQSKPAQ